MPSKTGIMTKQVYMEMHKGSTQKTHGILSTTNNGEDKDEILTQAISICIH